MKIYSQCSAAPPLACLRVGIFQGQQQRQKRRQTASGNTSGIPCLIHLRNRHFHRTMNVLVSGSTSKTTQILSACNMAGYVHHLIFPWLRKGLHMLLRQTHPSHQFVSKTLFITPSLTSWNLSLPTASLLCSTWHLSSNFGPSRMDMMSVFTWKHIHPLRCSTPTKR